MCFRSFLKWLCCTTMLPYLLVQSAMATPIGQNLLERLEVLYMVTDVLCWATIYCDPDLPFFDRAQGEKILLEMAEKDDRSAQALLGLLYSSDAMGPVNCERSRY